MGYSRMIFISYLRCLNRTGHPGTLSLLEIVTEAVLNNQLSHDNSLCEAEKVEHESGAISTSHYSEFQAFGDQALNDIYMHPCEMNFVR
jgi:hypothetical protein